MSRLLNTEQHKRQSLLGKLQEKTQHPELGNLFEAPPSFGANIAQLDSVEARLLAEQTSYLKSQMAKGKLGQESSYDGYVKLKDPFTATDAFNYLDAFFLGLQLDDFYEYTDECLEAIVFMLDDVMYYQNNRTLWPDAVPKENWFHPFLNITGLIGGNLSAIIPECYKFGRSVVDREKERWLRFEENWGNFFLAFLFNQMGNALNFQQKFTNIRLAQETQNYQGLWTEIGAIVHLVWDFEPLEDAAM